MNLQNESDSDSNSLQNRFFNEAVQLFLNYHWVYGFKMTEILFHQNLSQIPQVFTEIFDRIECEDFKMLLHHQGQMTPATASIDSLKDQGNARYSSELGRFIQDCQSLNSLAKHMEIEDNDTGEYLDRIPRIDGKDKDKKAEKYWKAKKYEEVVHLAQFIGQNCNRFDVKRVVDIGSGLGYLALKLNEDYKLQAMCIESDVKKISSAESLKSNSSSRSTSHNQSKKGNLEDIQHVNLKLSSDIISQVNPLVQNWSTCENEKICLTGLHSCGDLTPWTLDLFLSSSKYSMLAIVPCCYHKSFEEGRNFPKSKSLQNTITTISSINPQLSEDFFDIPFFRLGTQRPEENFLNSNISHEINCVFYRGIIELFAKNENALLVKCKRRPFRGILTTFEDYLERICLGYSLKYKSSISSDECIPLDQFKDRLLDLYKQKSDFYKTISGILYMQSAIQSIAETLILSDRIAYLKESKLVENAKLIQVIPKNISIRGKIIFAYKKTV